MMNSMLRPILVAVSIAISCQTALANETENPGNSSKKVLEDQKALETARLALAVEQLKVATEQLKLENKRIEVAKSALTAKQKEVEAAEKRINTGKIKIEAAIVKLVSNNDDSCGTKEFMKYHCQGKQECEVLLTQSICNLPKHGFEPMNITIVYRCDKLPPETFERGFRFAKPGENQALFDEKNKVFLSCY